MLRIPSADEIIRISRGDAFQAVQQQHADWSGGPVSTTRPTIPTQTEPNLTLVAPDEDQTGYDDSGSSSGSTEYSRESEIEDRIRELEANVPDQVSLIEIRNNELAQLRAELARLRGEEPPELLEPAIDDDTAGLDDEMLVDDAGVTDDDEIFVGDDADTGDDATTEPVVDTQAAPGRYRATGAKTIIAGYHSWLCSERLGSAGRCDNCGSRHSGLVRTTRRSRR